MYCTCAGAGVLLPVILLGLVYADCPAGQEQPLHHEAQLHKDLLCSYVSKYRPVKNHTSTVTVTVRFLFKHYSFDALEEVLTIHSLVTLFWKDELLHWEPKDYGGLDVIIVQSHEIWYPRMATLNTDASMYSTGHFYIPCTVDYTGNVTCVPFFANDAICQTALPQWPYDTKNCTLYLGSWMHKAEEINFTFYETDAMIMSEFQNGLGWKLLNAVNERLPGKYPCCPNDTYPTLQYTLTLKREAPGLAAIVIVPSIVLVVMTLTSITLDVKGNVRLILVCFGLLGHFTFLTEVGSIIPKHGAGNPILLLFIRDSMVITITAFLVTLLLMSITKRDHPVPRWILAVGQMVTSGPGKHLVILELESNDRKKLTDDDSEVDATDERKRAANEWMQFANLLNSITFIVIFFVYCILICAYIPRDD